ncbi:MAG: diguanylate cyclase [Alphaproteobacteria bacterium]|jgi:diguanylate cyclase|nr:diguanylate cyclase [Alphaproteobacteria bacterium]
MALHYDLDTDIKALEAVLDEYTEWFLQVTRRIFYPQHISDNKNQIFSCPPSFEAWVKSASSVRPDIVRTLRALHDDLCKRSELLMNNAVRERKPPVYEEFLKLTVLFEEFTGRIRRFEKDLVLGDSGIDALTGLRSMHALEKDTKREMERLARQGKTFAMALVRIDHFKDIQKEDPQEVEHCIKIVAELVKKSMRSFDDAYRGEDGMFILSLKQTGTPGGIKALKRLKKELDESKLMYKSKGVDTLVTLSSCIGEPNEGEELKTFLDNLQKDLDVYREDMGSVLEHFDLSPLQRYIRDKDQNQG